MAYPTGLAEWDPAKIAPDETIGNSLMVRCILLSSSIFLSSTQPASTFNIHPTFTFKFHVWLKIMSNSPSASYVQTLSLDKMVCPIMASRYIVLPLAIDSSWCNGTAQLSGKIIVSFIVVEFQILSWSPSPHVWRQVWKYGRSMIRSEWLDALTYTSPSDVKATELLQTQVICCKTTISRALLVDAICYCSYCRSIHA